MQQYRGTFRVCTSLYTTGLALQKACVLCWCAGTVDRAPRAPGVEAGPLGGGAPALIFEQSVPWWTAQLQPKVQPASPGFQDGLKRPMHCTE